MRSFKIVSANGLVSEHCIIADKGIVYQVVDESSGKVYWQAIAAFGGRNAQKQRELLAREQEYWAQEWAKKLEQNPMAVPNAIKPE